ncbi:hypothetical protein D9619_009404 [Psilocybe cf. subviscida]|uniref:Phosphatidylethanolamine-binding protein n=1 Tax=Psilocybe cf. subviscida TaxID=2480587 RepID=A0A8H5BUS8_9AGAR|nr:hypothetical protein D9619_009404 [Psilocybe cf. subviscida]
MSKSVTAVVNALKSSGAIPDVIPQSFTPSINFNVFWPSKGKEATIGEALSKESTQEEPEIKVLPTDGPGGTDANATYTMVMTDPDAPSRQDPKWGQFRHWVLPGLKLPAGGSLQAQKTKPAATPYMGPAPPPGSGFHRYIFLLFQEPAGGLSLPTDATESSGGEKSRPKWNAMTFAERNQLKLVGATFFQTEVKE